MLRGVRAVLASRHGKEHVIGPAFVSLGITLEVVAVDTDQFGTLAVPGVRSAGDAAFAKARAALAAIRHADFGIGSEGTFGALNRELVALVQRDAPLALLGGACGEIVRRGVLVTSVLAAEDAAEELGFPSAGILLMTPDRRVPRELRHLGDLRDGVEEAIAAHGAAWLEPDRRANRDPARRAVIAQAARSLADKLRERFAAPGFASSHP